MKISALLTLLLLACTASAAGDPRGLFAEISFPAGTGPGIAVDPCMPYYAQRSWDATFRQIYHLGFDDVFLLDTGATCPSHPGLPELCRKARSAGLNPIIRIHPGTDQRLYDAHPEWRQRMLGGGSRHDWRTYLCPNDAVMMRAYTAQLQQTVQECEPAAIQLAEPWLEQWGGPADGSRPRSGYACICTDCLALFKTRCRVDPIELLTSAGSPLYFERPEGREAYAEWVRFRVDTVTSMARQLADAARRGSGRVQIDLMLLADTRVESGKAREYQGIDVDALMHAVRPERVTLQDAWQDWLKPDLQPDFVVAYADAYRARLKGLNGGVHLYSHADIGSRTASRRSISWITDFARATVKSGLTAPTFYEFSVSCLVDERP